MSEERFDEHDVGRILEAARFSAEKHRDDRRKGDDESPYINHPLEVAETIWRVGGVRDLDTIVAAILHDTVEDTDATAEEIGERFGAAVRALVEEVTDDKELAKEERKRLQVEHAPHLSPGAKQIKIADKASNVRDVAHHPPAGWSHERKVRYLDWADEVVAGLRDASPRLAEHYDRVVREAREVLGATPAR